MHILCIMATIRTKKTKNLLFIHLNLCTALALGLLVFISGIEGASDNKASLACYEYS